MSSNLRAKFNEWIFIFVLLPAALMMLICLFFFWRLLNQNHQRILDDEVTVVSSALDQVLHAESLRMRTLLNLPATESLITMARRRLATGGAIQESKAETAWIESARDDMMVRSVLDNDIGILFRQICDQQGAVRSILLADAVGQLLAASEKTKTYRQSLADWWPLTRQASPEKAASEADTHSGRLGLLLTRAASSGGGFSAVVRVELDVESLLKNLSVIGRSTNASRVMVFLVGQDTRLVSGPADEDTLRVGQELAVVIHASGIPSGWSNGYRYDGRMLDAGIAWARPLWIVAANAESRLPLSLFGPLAMAAAIGCAAVFGIFVLSRNIGSRLFFEPMREAAEAGVWVLRRAGGRVGDLAGADGLKPGSGRASEHPWASIEYDENTPLHKELNHWFTHVKETSGGDASQLSAAVKYDLELATEFQQAFMNRPMPDVPDVYTEGRLRLEFAHAYRPALALGGDFFDVEAVGPDCAGIFIGDVMGHGTRSALLTSTIRTLIHEHYKLGRNPAHFLRELNRSLCEILRVLPGQFFASACYFAADTTGRVGTYSTAGHPPPFHLHRNVGRVIRLEKPKPRGAALGVIPDEQYGADSVRLVDGDLFVFYTDGAYEAATRDGEQFGIGRLEKSLQAHIYERPADLLNKVMEDIAKFVGDEPLADDICLVAVHVTAKPPAKT